MDAGMEAGPFNQSINHPMNQEAISSHIQQALSKINAEISSLRPAENGKPGVKLVAVTKYASDSQMIAAYDAGLRDFGENKVQDALDKMERLPQEMVQSVSWHLIGHLQSNKAKKTVGRFSLIHSVDTISLAEELSLRNVKANLRQPVLIQVNVSEEATKHGFAPDSLCHEFGQLLQFSGLEIRGLMTMAPHTKEAGIIEKTFISLHELRDSLVHEFGNPLPELSMGMSGDYVHAIQCGATIIRIGSAFFAS